MELAIARLGGQEKPAQKRLALLIATTKDIVWEDLVCAILNTLVVTVPLPNAQILAQVLVLVLT